MYLCVYDARHTAIVKARALILSIRIVRNVYVRQDILWMVSFIEQFYVEFEKPKHQTCAERRKKKNK